jgi:chorismate mutase
MACRGIRGATTAASNTVGAILEASRELLQMMIDANDIRPEDVACAVFTTTPDLNAAFPATAARQLGWTDAALLCATEIDVPGALDSCIRILILYNTDKSAAEIAHVYVKGAKDLRADLSGTR